MQQAANGRETYNVHYMTKSLSCQLAQNKPDGPRGVFCSTLNPKARGTRTTLIDEEHEFGGRPTMRFALVHAAAPPGAGDVTRGAFGGGGW